MVKYGGATRLKYQSVRDADKCMYMAGNEVFKVAVTQLSKLVKDTLAANNMDKSELDWLVPHQANYRIISATCEKADNVTWSGGADHPW